MSNLRVAFEGLARDFLASNTQVIYEWRLVPSKLGGERMDLVCAPGSDHEVFATLTEGQLTIGPTRGDHEDFEDFGRGLAPEVVAQEAFDSFVKLLRKYGHVTSAA
jgi:hypothetical protein